MEPLTEYLKARQPAPFKAVPIYSKEGDSLSFILENVPYYRERIDDFLTVYRAMLPGDNGQAERLVGCQIKGLPATLKLLGSFDLTISNEPIRLTMLFLACMANSEKAEVKHFYIDLAERKESKNASILPAELVAA